MQIRKSPNTASPSMYMATKNVYLCERKPIKCKSGVILTSNVTCLLRSKFCNFLVLHVSLPFNRFSVQFIKSLEIFGANQIFESGVTMQFDGHNRYSTTIYNYAVLLMLFDFNSS